MNTRTERVVINKLRLLWQYLTIIAVLSISGLIPKAFGQLTSYDAYQQQFQNHLGVADTTTERVMAQQQAIRGGYDPQALEGAIDPKTYQLGPGDGLYLNVYASHALDQDLTVTPEGKLLVPRIGEIEVDGITVTEAEKKINILLQKVYRDPNASLSLRRLRPLKVSVLGEVLQPGMQTATAMQRLSEIIDKSGGLKPHSSLRNIEIRRQDGSLRARADLDKYFSSYDVTANPIVESGDVIIVPKIERFVTVSGSVAAPGTIEFVVGDSLSTIVELCRGLLPNALADSVEVSRFDQNDPSHAHRIYVNFKAHQDILIQDGDAIFIRAIPEFHHQRLVAIGGEVKYPGKYAIDLDKTRLREIIDRAGGPLPTASLEESVLIRRAGIGSWEEEPEWIRLSSLGGANRERMTDDEYNYYEARMRQSTRTIMVVDFKALLDQHDDNQNILLRDEDSIWFPRARGFVNVTGSVNNQGNVVLIENGTYLDYIRKAGGFNSSADRSAVRIINSRTSSYIDPSSDKEYKIGPGDTIVIPSEHSDFWKNFALATAITAQVLTIIAGVLLIVVNGKL